MCMIYNNYVCFLSILTKSFCYFLVLFFSFSIIVQPINLEISSIYEHFWAIFLCAERHQAQSLIFDWHNLRYTLYWDHIKAADKCNVIMEFFMIAISLISFLSARFWPITVGKDIISSFTADSARDSILMKNLQCIKKLMILRCCSIIARSSNDIVIFYS